MIGSAQDLKYLKQLVNLRRPVEQRSEITHLCNYTTGRPHVHSRGVVLSAQQDFWGSVPKRDHFMSVLVGGCAEYSGQSEIRKFQVSLRVDEQVLRFKIAMQDALGVAFRQSSQHLDGKRLEDPWIHALRPDGLNVHSEVLREKLKHQVQVVLLLVHCAQINNVIIAHLLENRNLPQRSGRVPILDIVQANPLQRHEVTRLSVPTFEHGPIRALTDPFQSLVYLVHRCFLAFFLHSSLDLASGLFSMLSRISFYSKKSSHHHRMSGVMDWKQISAAVVVGAAVGYAGAQLFGKSEDKVSLNDSIDAKCRKVVLDFLDAQSERNLDKMCALVDENLVYINEPHPIERAIRGREMFREVFAASPCIWCENADLRVIQVSHERGSDTVFVERLDRFFVDGHWLEIPICGYLKVRQDKVILWKDYWDYTKYKKFTTEKYGPDFRLFRKTAELV